MKATHSFQYKGITGYVFADGMVRWENVTAHIDSLAGGLRTRAIFTAKPL